MAATQVIRGNMFKIVAAITENSIAYADLGTADVVKVKLTSSNKQTTLELDDTDANVTLDDPATGSVSWQLTSPQTALLPVGSYSLAVQVEYGGNTNILEWVESNSIEIVTQDI